MNDTQSLKDFEIQGDRHIHNDKGTHSMTNIWEKSCKHRDKAGINQVDRKLTWRPGELQRGSAHCRWLQRLGRSFHVGWSMCLLHSGQDEEEGRQEAGIAWTKESDTTVSVRGQPDPDQWGDTDSRSVQTAREWTVTGAGAGNTIWG